jgi:DNA repair exonuclease SbcCD ATPase subunit
MKIESIEFKNFNSYGNKITKIDFDKDNNMIMLIGQSGHGKSTIREVISYLAYGKVLDKKMGDLPNRINKSLWGKIILIANKSKVEIERGLHPSIFNVFVDGKPLETAGKTNIQEILETEYFKIPQTTFDNVISISVDKFKSFLTMSASDKRKILDQIFGIVFFNKVNEKLKEQVRELNGTMNTIEGQVDVLNENKKQIKEKIKSLDAEKTQNISDRLDEISSILEGVQSDINKVNERSSTLSDKIIKVDTAYQKYKKTKNEYTLEIKQIDHKISLYNSDKCHECGSSLKTKKHQDTKKELEERKKELKTKLEDCKSDIDKIEDIKSKISSARTKIEDELFELNVEKKKLESESKKLENTDKNKSNDFTEVLDKTIEKINELLNSLDTYKKETYIYTELSKIFGEDGVKLQIMKNFLPSFNKNINEFSKKLHFPYKIEIDEKFNSKIISIGEEINPKTLSTGERKKADFAVLVSLIKIMKRNYPSINLLFLDEILASIDSYGVYEMLSLIRDIVDELNLHAFVINHSELPPEMFNSIYAVNKVAGFSELEIKPC